MFALAAKHKTIKLCVVDRGKVNKPYKQYWPDWMLVSIKRGSEVVHLISFLYVWINNIIRM